MRVLRQHRSAAIILTAAVSLVAWAPAGNAATSPGTQLWAARAYGVVVGSPDYFTDEDFATVAYAG